MGAVQSCWMPRALGQCSMDGQVKCQISSCFFFILLFSFPARIFLSLGVQLLTGSFREGDEMLGDDMGEGGRAGFDSYESRFNDVL